MSWNFERVAGEFNFTEGPVWDGEGVIFSDMPSDKIYRYDISTDECTVLHGDTNAANGLKMDPQGRLYTCEMNGRRIGRYDHEYKIVVDEYLGDPLNSPNDLAFDQSGNLWFTDPYYGAPWETPNKNLALGHRSVYRMDPEDPDSIVRLTFDTSNPNGILVTEDMNHLFVAEEDPDGDRELRRYPILSEEALGNVEVIHEFTPHRGIDGMCFDENENIVATAGSNDGGPGPLLYVFAQDGEVIETHASPTPKPTNCCFGGEDLSTLFVTGGDGCLHAADTDRIGLLGAPTTALVDEQ